jgi:hypothetical protein
MTIPAIFRNSLFFLLAVSPEANAQTSSVDLLYGNTIFRKDLAGQVNTIDAYTFGKPLQFVGIGVNELRLNRGEWLSASFTGAQYLPQKFVLNDSVAGKISGCLFGFALGRNVLRESEFFDLTFSAGLNLGRLKLVKHDALYLKNNVVAPKLSVIARIFFGKLALGLNAEFVYDCSSSGWKDKLLSSKRIPPADVPGFNQTGFNFSVSLGWGGI